MERLALDEAPGGVGVDLDEVYARSQVVDVHCHRGVVVALEGSYAGAADVEDADGLDSLAGRDVQLALCGNGPDVDAAVLCVGGDVVNTGKSCAIRTVLVDGNRLGSVVLPHRF